MHRFDIPAAALLAAALFLAPVPYQDCVQAQEPTLVWHDLYDGGSGQHDEGIALLFAEDGHLIVGGMRTPAGGRSEIFIRKMDRTDGSVLWTHAAGDPYGNDLFLTDMLLDHRGDLLVAGYLSNCSG